MKYKIQTAPPFDEQRQWWCNILQFDESEGESYGGTPVTDRPNPELQALLGQLKNLDSEGWCAMTDGSFDDEEDESIMITLRDSIKYLLNNQ